MWRGKVVLIEVAVPRRSGLLRLPTFFARMPGPSMGNTRDAGPPCTISSYALHRDHFSGHLHDGDARRGVSEQRRGEANLIGVHYAQSFAAMATTLQYFRRVEATLGRLPSR